MKIRTDFVTNSSSSSFILSQKGDFTEAQKEAILQYAKDNLFGDVLLTPDSSEEEIQKVFHDYYMNDEQEQTEIREQLAQGKTIRYGYVSFEESEYSYGCLFSDLWEILEKTDPGTFTVVEGDLSY